MSPSLVNKVFIQNLPILQTMHAYHGLLFQMSYKCFTTFYMSCLVNMREIQKANASKMNVMYGCNNLRPIHHIKKVNILVRYVLFKCYVWVWIK